MYIAVFILITISLYSLIALFLKIPRFSAISQLSVTTSSKANVLTNIKQYFVSHIASIVPVSKTYEQRLNKMLYLIKAKETAKEHIAFIVTKILASLIVGLLLWMVSGQPAFIILCVIAVAYLVYKKEMALVKQSIAHREEIEREIPRFTSYVSTALKTTHNLVQVLSGYVNNNNTMLSNELVITVADIKTGGIETGLARFEQRVNSLVLTEIVSALIAVCRGDDMSYTFDRITQKVEVMWDERAEAETIKKSRKLNRKMVAMVIMAIAVVMVGFIGSIVQMGMQIF